MHILTNLYGAPRVNGENFIPAIKKNLKSPSDILMEDLPCLKDNPEYKGNDAVERKNVTFTPISRSLCPSWYRNYLQAAAKTKRMNYSSNTPSLLKNLSISQKRYGSPNKNNPDAKNNGKHCGRCQTLWKVCLEWQRREDNQIS